jgi:uncharacterized protein (TIGR03382 family)
MGNGQVEDPTVGCDEVGPALEWKDACISYAIDGRGSQFMSNTEIEQAIDLAFEEWENVDCGGGTPPNVVFTPLQASNCQRAEYNCEGNVNTIAFLNPWRDPCRTERYSSAAFAVTLVFFNTQTGEILDADMMINDELSNGRTAGGPYANCPDTGCRPSVGGPQVADLQSIVAHEIGHMIGVGHSEFPEATMYATAERGSIQKRTLHPDDEDAICSIYPPGNLAQDCDATPNGGLELDCEQKACTTGSCPAGSTSSGGCSASGDLGTAPVGGIAVALLAVIALRRRRYPLAARS